MRLDDLISKKAGIVAKMRGTLELIEKETRSTTPEEEKTYTELEAQLELIGKDIVREEKLVAEEKRLALPRSEPFRSNAKIEPGKTEEFKSLGEFFSSIRFNRADNRLVYKEFEQRAQSMTTGESGGFMVPEKFLPEILSVSPQEAIFRPRCTVIPGSDSPDQTVTMPCLDQTAAKNMYGGVTVASIAEGVTLSETDFHLREVSLTPHETGAYIVLTDKLLRNWAAAGAVTSNLLRQALIAFEDSAFYSGNGVSKPTGIVAHAASIQYSRNTSSQVLTVDVVGMYARLMFGGSPVWIASQTVLPYLAVLKDANNNALFMQNLVGNMPGTLMGIPVLLNQRSAALGSTGDLVLADLKKYLIKDGMGIYIATSEHVYFTSNKTVFKAIFSVDGKPWLSAPIPLEGATSNTVSPFIILN